MFSRTYSHTYGNSLATIQVFSWWTSGCKVVKVKSIFFLSLFSFRPSLKESLMLMYIDILYYYTSNFRKIFAASFFKQKSISFFYPFPLMVLKVSWGSECTWQHSVISREGSWHLVLDPRWLYNLLVVAASSLKGPSWPMNTQDPLGASLYELNLQAPERGLGRGTQSCSCPESLHFSLTLPVPSACLCWDRIY